MGARLVRRRLHPVHLAVVARAATLTLLAPIVATLGAPHPRQAFGLQEREMLRGVSLAEGGLMRAPLDLGLSTALTVTAPRTPSLTVMGQPLKALRLRPWTVQMG